MSGTVRRLGCGDYRPPAGSSGDLVRDLCDVTLSQLKPRGCVRSAALRRAGSFRIQRFQLGNATSPCARTRRRPSASVTAAIACGPSLPPESTSEHGVVQLPDRRTQVLEVSLDALAAVFASMLADTATALERFDDALAHRPSFVRDAHATRSAKMARDGVSSRLSRAACAGIRGPSGPSRATTNLADGARTSITRWRRATDNARCRFAGLSSPLTDSNRRLPPYHEREEGIDPCGFARSHAASRVSVAAGCRRVFVCVRPWCDLVER